MKLVFWKDKLINSFFDLYWALRQGCPPAGHKGNICCIHCYQCHTRSTIKYFNIFPRNPLPLSSKQALQNNITLDSFLNVHCKLKIQSILQGICIHFWGSCTEAHQNILSIIEHFTFLNLRDTVPVWRPRKECSSLLLFLKNYCFLEIFPDSGSWFFMLLNHHNSFFCGFGPGQTTFQTFPGII